MEVTQHLLWRTLLVRASHKASPDSRRGEERQSQTAEGSGTGKFLGDCKYYKSPQSGTDMISARVHTSSVSPLNSKAFEELKILFTFVPPAATRMVLSTQCVVNKFMWIN